MALMMSRYPCSWRVVPPLAGLELRIYHTPEVRLPDGLGSDGLRVLGLDAGGIAHVGGSPGNGVSLQDTSVPPANRMAILRRVDGGVHRRRRSPECACRRSSGTLHPHRHIGETIDPKMNVCRIVLIVA